jgi:hypothetical protein
MKPYNLLKYALLTFAVAFVSAAMAAGAPVVEWMHALRSGGDQWTSYAVMSGASITAFKDQFGAYYQPRGQNAERLRKLLMQNTTAFDAQFTTMPMNGDVLETGLMTHGRVLQAFKPKWSPLGQLQGTPRKTALRRVKINVEEIPDQLVNTWLGFLADAEGKDPNVNRATWPFVRWYVEKYLIPQAKQDQYYEAYYGVWADPGTDATPSAEGTALDGIMFQLNTDIDNGDITTIPTGALDTDPEAFLEQVEAFAEQIDNRYRGEMLDINMHDTYAQRFKAGLEEKNLLTPNEVKGTNMYTLPKRTNIRVVGHFNWLQGVGGAPSEKFLCAPKGILVKAVRTGSKEDSTLRLEQVDYTLKMFNDWHVLYTYMDPRVVFTNDQELDYGL